MAQKATQTVDTDVQVPAGTPQDKIDAYKSLLRSNAYSIIGTIEFKKENYPAAQESLQKSIDALKSNAAPTLIYAYGEPDRIQLASTGSFFGINLDTFLGAGGPFQVPSLLGNAMRMHPRQ